MDVDEAFEQLYKSVSQEEENHETKSISGDSLSSSTADNVTVSENSASSPQMALEMLTQFSTHLNTESRSYKHGKSVFTDKKENLSLVYISKCRVDTKSSAASRQEKKCTVKTQNSADKLYDEPNFEECYSVHCSDIEQSYERVDGYESGLTKEQSDERYLCKDCKKLFKKARKMKCTTEEIPKKPAYSHWRSKFWMMIKRVPSQRRNKRKEEKRNRTLNRVVRKLKTSRQTGNFYVGCCRIHSFLKRNLCLSTTTKKVFHSLNGTQKRKRPTPAQKSSKKSTEERKEASFSCSIEKKDDKKTYVFVLDSSEEEDTSLNVKRYKLLAEDLERNSIQKHRENSRSLPNIIVEPINTWQEQNTSEHADIDSPATQDEDLSTFHQRLNTSPQDSDGSLFGASPSHFAHVQGGSFKELLQRMNSGYLRSGIVRENRI